MMLECRGLGGEDESFGAVTYQIIRPMRDDEMDRLPSDWKERAHRE